MSALDSIPVPHLSITFAANCFYAKGDLDRSMVFNLHYSFVGVWF
jgi:hypothetical protein